MNQNNQDTDDILDAIKSMMSNDRVVNEQNLPKDIIELTKPVENEKDNNNDDKSILELTELVTEDQPEKTTLGNIEEKKNLRINSDQIREVIRNTIESLPDETINDILNEELKKFVLEKLNGSKISISSQDHKE